MTMRIFNAYVKADEIRRKRRDNEDWMLGAYIKDAVTVAIENNFAKHAKMKYMDKPFLQQIEEQHKQENLTEEQKIEQTKAFFLRLKILQSNFEMEKSRKDSMGS